MGTTFTCVATGDWDDDATWGLTDSDYPGKSGATDDVVIIDVANKSGGPGDLTVTLVADVELKAIKMAGTASGDATLHTASEHTLTLNDTEFSGYSAHVTGQTGFTGNVNFIFTKSGTTHIIIDPASQTNKLNDITYNHASLALHMLSNITIKGDLIGTAGTLSTQASGGGTSYALTVTGACTLNGGTLTGNASTVSHGSLTISSGTYNATNQTTTLNGTVDVGMRVDGTFNNNDGTFVIDGSITKVQMGSIGGAPTGFSINNAPFHHLTINDSINFAWGTGTLFNVEGDLIVAAGQTLGANNENSGIKVLGDVTLNGTLGNSNITNDCEFGSLKIASGGTYLATSGTTTLTNKNSSNYMLEDLGTFTHNNGTVHFKADTSSGTWYAVKGHSTEDTTEFYNVTTERVGSSVGNYRVCVGGSNQFFTVRNNLTVGANCKIFSSNGSSILRHSGLATLNGELDLDSFTDIEMGAVTINSGGTLEFDNGSITIKAESLRNVGGTINA